MRARQAFGSWFGGVPPIYLVAIAVVAGDAAGGLGLEASGRILIGLTVAALLAYLTSRPAIGLALSLITIAAAAGVSSASSLHPAAGAKALRGFPDRALITIEGWIVREPESRPEVVRLYVAADRAGPPGGTMKPVEGVIRVTALGNNRFKIGQRVRLTSRIRFPRNYGDPGEFDYEAFMARDGVAALMTARRDSLGTDSFRIVGYRRRFPEAQVESIRDRIRSFIEDHLEQPEAGEMRALVIGDRRAIDPAVRRDFVRAGVAHLLVISGLHLSLVAVVVFALVRAAVILMPEAGNRGWANKIAALAAIAAGCAYASIAGHHLSTLRALVMVSVYMLAVVIDRGREVAASLALAAIVICLGLPGSSADIGFELSFASVLAIVLGMRRFTAWAGVRERTLLMPRERVMGTRLAATSTLGYFAVSFWALIGVAPLTAWYFNQLSIVGVISNAVVVPVIGMGATVGGLVAAALSFVSPGPADWVLGVAGWFLKFGNFLVAAFARWPLAWTRTFTPTILELILVYALLALWLSAPLKREMEVRAMADSRTGWVARAWEMVRRPFGWRIGCAMLLAAALAADTGWWIYHRYFHPELRVTFLSVGEGDSAVVEFPGSRVMVIDGGGGFGTFDPGERLVARYLWSRKVMRVDYLVLSHPDFDHFDGLGFIVRNFSPREFWTIPASSPDRSYVEFLIELMRAGVPLKLIGPRGSLTRIGGVRVEAFSAGSPARASRNDRSMILRLGFGGSSFLFTGDIEWPAEQRLVGMRGSIEAEVLKVPHHGSATSSSRGFLEAVRPKVAVISAGYHNRFHFPAAAVLERYQRLAVRVMRTDLQGAITVEATRRRMRLWSRRGASILNSKGP